VLLLLLNPPLLTVPGGVLSRSNRRSAGGGPGSRASAHSPQVDSQSRCKGAAHGVQPAAAAAAAADALRSDLRWPLLGCAEGCCCTTRRVSGLCPQSRVSTKQHAEEPCGGSADALGPLADAARLRSAPLGRSSRPSASMNVSLTS